MTDEHVITQKEIAEKAGVSVGTVSSVLNDRKTVSSEMRARVMDVAISLGYQPKNKRNVIENTKVSVIGLLVKHDLGLTWDINPFYSRVQLGVTNTCQQRHISLMVAHIEVDSSNRPITWPAMIDQHHVDGLIMAGAFIDDTVQMVKRKFDIPIVLVDSYAPDQPCDSIITDNVGGAKKAVGYLVENQHQQIALVGWNPQSPPSIQQRRLGYLETLADFGLQPHVIPSDLTREGGQAAVKALFQTGSQVTALFCCNDETAIGAINAIREMGLQVPQDISVIGFDNISLAAERSLMLTTIHIHKSWMGTLGVQTLIDRVNNPELPKITIVLSTDLVVRETVSQPLNQLISRR
jgi:DNA-binding LacI/PurR family transcriptional regulator